MALFWAILALAGYFALFGGEYGAVSLWRIERAHVQEVSRVEALRDEVERLRARADSLETDSATLERIARERYGLIREGERLYRFVDATGAEADR